MTAKTPAPPVWTPVTNPFSAWALLGDLGRHQLSVAAESASAMLRGFETMRTVQQETAHQAAAQYLTAARMLCAPYEPAELMAVESELLESDVEDVGNYWQHLATAALQSQVEMMTNASRFFNGAAGSAMMPALQARQPAIAGSAAKQTVQPKPRAGRSRPA